VDVTQRDPSASLGLAQSRPRTGSNDGSALLRRGWTDRSGPRKPRRCRRTSHRAWQASSSPRCW